MVYSKMLAVLCFVALSCTTPAHAVEPESLSVQLKAGAYFTATKDFDPGTGIDAVFSYRPSPYAAIDTALGYYRAERGADGFLSAIPLTVTVRGILPLSSINLYAGGGGGVYYKMAGGLTELPADHSEFRLGYHGNAGIEFPASNNLSLLLDYRYVVVDQGKFKSYGIKHDGSFIYGGFSLNY